MDKEKDLEELKEELQKLIKSAQADINAVSTGTIYAKKDGRSVQYYLKQSGKENRRKYIRRSDEGIAKSYIQKEYAELVLKMAREDEKIINQLPVLYNVNDYADCVQKISEKKRGLLKPYVLNDKDYAAAWEAEQKAVKENKKDIRVHALNDNEDDAIITERGEIVRSKSEKIIADKLYRAGIPYIYEFPVNIIGIGYVRPDFYVLNVRTREAFYWEHFGMMDNPEYSGNAVRKIEMYEKNKIFPGRSLILTYETSSHPINNRAIDEVIDEYLK